MTSLRVLLAEDGAEVGETMKYVLEELGHTVTLAVDGPGAVREAGATRPEVALIDIGLPGIDGYEVARQIRASPGGSSIYLVALTGFGGGVAQAKARTAGFDRHVVKPIELDDLPRLLVRSP